MHNPNLSLSALHFSHLTFLHCPTYSVSGICVVGGIDTVVEASVITIVGASVIMVVGTSGIIVVGGTMQFSPSCL